MTSITRLLLVRHAQSAPDRSRPEPDWPLSEVGRRQAEALVPVLMGIGVDRLASSPCVRAIDTLRPFAAASGQDIEIHADLRERRITAGWIENLEPELVRMHADLAYGWPDGETGHEAAARMRNVLHEIARLWPGGCVAVGTHGAVICHLLRSLGVDLDEHYWRRVRNPHLFEFEVGESIVWIGEMAPDGSEGVMRGALRNPVVG
jgi:2,3-bisphosphoglycerate-dependent phosphoglycerate mutase